MCDLPQLRTSYRCMLSQLFSAMNASSKFRLVLPCLLAYVSGIGAAEASGGLALVTKWPTGESVCSDAPLRLTFDRAPAIGGTGRIEIERASDHSVVESIDVASRTRVDRFGAHSLNWESIWIEGRTAHVRLHPHVLASNETYSVRVSAGAFKDDEGHEFSGSQQGWTFTVRPAMPRNPSRITVAADGSADFCTVQGAIDQVEPHREQEAVIFIRKGRYHELVRIVRERRHVRLVGEDRKGTIISCTNNDKLNPGWIQRAVLGVEGDDFVLENLTVQNTTPYKGSQAEAVYVSAERCILKNADLLSFQDTLNLSGRVYVNGCYVEGDVDYVWGYGTAVFERCHLHTLHDGYLVQARNSEARDGYVFLDCKLTAAPEVKKLWLARIETARFPGSQVTFIRCAITPQFMATGWQLTGEAGPTLRFEEFGSTDLDDKPLDLSKRDAASKQLTAEQVTARTVAQILGGTDSWHPKP